MKTYIPKVAKHRDIILGRNFRICVWTCVCRRYKQTKNQTVVTRVSMPRQLEQNSMKILQTSQTDVDVEKTNIKHAFS